LGDREHRSVPVELSSLSLAPASATIDLIANASSSFATKYPALSFDVEKLIED
jgi:hypothetical protein